MESIVCLRGLINGYRWTGDIKTAKEFLGESLISSNITKLLIRDVTNELHTIDQDDYIIQTSNSFLPLKLFSKYNLNTNPCPGLKI